ncbi:MAG: hypothetical protein AB7P03_15050 [Kofleriaceae bacterium]
MTMPDLGPERPYDASETRQLGERGRTTPGTTPMSGRTFIIALVLVAAVIAIAVAALTHS